MHDTANIKTYIITLITTHANTYDISNNLPRIDISAAASLIIASTKLAERFDDGALKEIDYRETHRINDARNYKTNSQNKIIVFSFQP